MVHVDSSTDDICISGFMSVDRMDALLGNLGPDITRSVGQVQGIYPEVNFTCSGNIQSWILGASWIGSTDSRYIELQIWRPGNKDGYYTKVGSSTIISEENRTQLHHYSLSTPLPFQAGDVLGYYQPAASSSQLALLFEVDRQTPLKLGYFFHNQENASSQLNLSESDASRQSSQIFINVQTGQSSV